MKRFAKGDLALTCNSRAPLINDGHLVTILEVIGPDPGFGLSFAYLVERVDGADFLIAARPGIPMPTGGGPRVLADQHQLRPLRERPEEAGEPVQEEAGA